MSLPQQFSTNAIPVGTCPVKGCFVLTKFECCMQLLCKTENNTASEITAAAK